MAEADLVSGEGWISDDSSWYADEDEHEAQPPINLNSYWHMYKPDLNALLTSSKNVLRAKPIQPANADMPNHEAPSQQTTSALSKVDRSSTGFLLDRRNMEEARLGRLGKRKRESSPESSPWNPGQGRPDSWQLGEAADTFIKRVPPLTTSTLTCPWIWAYDPHQRPQDRNNMPRTEDFTSRGRLLLEESQQTRKQLHTKHLSGSKAMLTKTLNQESRALEERITGLAAESGVLSGKWMLFPPLEDVTRVWRSVVGGVTSGRLGPTAKVATDDGNPGERLICVYTKDFRDEDDVLRVLQELDTMGLLASGRTIYYKSDAFTYLDLYKQTASEYGLQASLYSSYKMMAASRLLRASSSMPRKKQSTLNSYF